MQEIFHNARIVLENEVVEGSVSVDNGLIVSIDQGRLRSGAGVDLDGDYLMPGIIDVHSDNIEKLIAPRPNAVWPARSAAIAHDAYTIGVGITTILDAVCLSNPLSLGGASGSRSQLAASMINGIVESQKLGDLRAEHFIHVRCELTDPDIVARVADLGNDLPIKMFTVMDHTPGQRVFKNIETWRSYRKKGRGLTDVELDQLQAAEIEARETYASANRNAIARLAVEMGAALAGHDDSTVDEVNEAAALGATASEFPTTLEAAQAARAVGLKTIMGGPNLVRGGSHLGNLSAEECAAHGVLDILASDYMPVSLLQAAFMLTADHIGYSLPRAISTVTSAPADASGLADRGRIQTGKKADLLRVRICEGFPILGAVWRSGIRVH